jgi:DNA polymerase
MSDDPETLPDALARRLEFERLFGLEEVYVGRKRAGAKASVEGSKGEPSAKSKARAPAEANGDADRYKRRKAAVEAARKRRGERERAPAAGKTTAAPASAGGKGEVQYDFTIEELPGSQVEASLLSEAERAGIPYVSDTPGSAAERLEKLREVALECTRCKLAGGRNKVVFGEGDPDAALVFVGEAPGAEEDKTGRPFVGRAGKLLTKIIASIDLTREQVYICNVLKCRPPGNRAPMPDEVTACSPFLHEQLAVIGPKVICALGGPATTTLLRTRQGITRLRGRLFWYRGIPLMPTFHPAYLLRNAREKRTVWEDMKKLRAFLASR